MDQLRLPGGLRAVHRNPRSVPCDRCADDLKEVTMDIKPIKTDADYRAALKEIESLMMAEMDTPEGERLDVLATLVEAYEQRHFPHRTGRPVVGWSARGAGRGVCAGPGRVAGGCLGCGLTQRRAPGGRTRVRGCRSRGTDQQKRSDRRGASSMVQRQRSGGLAAPRAAPRQGGRPVRSPQHGVEHWAPRRHVTSGGGAAAADPSRASLLGTLMPGDQFPHGGH